MKIGITELIVIFIVALFVIGPDKLPSYAKKLGEALAQFRKYSQEAAADIKESIVEPLEEAQRPLREAVEPLQEIDREIRGNVKEVRDSFAGIGKPKKKTDLKKEADKEMKKEMDKDFEKDFEETLTEDLAEDSEKDLTKDTDEKEPHLDLKKDTENTENAPVSDIDLTEAVLEKSGEESA